MTTNVNIINNTQQATFPIFYYCDPGDVQRRLSNEAVKLRTQDYGDNPISGESGVIDDCIWDATETINFYCFPHYEPGSLSRSAWINRRAVDLSVYFLCIRRANTPSVSVEARYKQALIDLDRIHSGRYEVPGIPVRATQAPAFSNFHIDQRYPVGRCRVERSLSEKTPTGYPQFVDWCSEYSYCELY